MYKQASLGCILDNYIGTFCGIVNVFPPILMYEYHLSVDQWCNACTVMKEWEFSESLVGLGCYLV